MDFKQLNNNQLMEYIRQKIASYEMIREQMILGEDYYYGTHDILKKFRGGIGKDGRVVKIYNLPNSKLVDNQYARAVDQKVNYLFSKPPSVDSKDSAYLDLLIDTFDRKFLRTLNKIAQDTYNNGIAWLYLYTDGEGLQYKKMESKDIIPVWTDDAHESLDAVIRLYSYETLEGNQIVKKYEVHFFTDEIIKIYTYDNNQLVFKEEQFYMSKANKYYNFGKIPFIYFKLPEERPLIYRVKGLQDALNTMISNFADNMLEDPRNTILIIKNYDGQDLGEFREKLSQYGAVKVTTEDGQQGGLDSLEIKVNHENYQAILQIIKQAITENVRSLDLKNEKTTQAPNMLNIKAMYSDMELDANALELEFSASLDHFCDFLKQVKNIQGEADITFKRNIMVNDESLVTMIKDSIGIVSEETLRSKHPLVDDAEEEGRRIKKEQEEKLLMMSDYGGQEDELLGTKKSTEQ